MEFYNFSGQGNAETYLIQGAEIDPLSISSLPKQVGVMFNEGNPEFVVDQGQYYPPATNYGYYCTGFEPPSEWEDHRIFGVDGPEIQYAGATESLPYVYYTPSYGYAQSPYNPYNPYIPGATMTVDGPYGGGQQFYTIPSYQDPGSSHGYIPVVIQPENPNGFADTFLDPGVVLADRPDGRSLKQGLASSSAVLPRNPSKPASNQTNSFTRISEGPRANVGPSKQSATHGNISSSSFTTSASPHVLQSRSASGSIQPTHNISNGNVLPHRNQLKVALPANNSFPDFGSSGHGRIAVDKLQSQNHIGRTLDVNRNLDSLGEQNRGPRTNKPKNQFAVKAYPTVGDSNAQGTFVMYNDQCNKDDFPVDYVDAKFFVIKSYSEDDVHKSIKYNVWSSTAHGNKKLQTAYEDAQKIAAGKHRGCPIFLFFSVNASGQFCGVTEMMGAVDFHNDMDFWQQDKWNGSFPVKWHIIKDVPNTSFRHIILENNENKPVTNSRDTQEIPHRQGLDMLRIFKSHTLKTSLLDDFMYYEDRQKIMQEEKARIIYKSFETPHLVAVSDPLLKMNYVVELHPNKDEKIMEQNDPNNSTKKTDATNFSIGSGNSEQINVKVEDNIALKIGSLNIRHKQAESKPLRDTATSIVSVDPVNVVTVGSVPVKVNGSTESSSFLTVGSIPLDPKALQTENSGACAKYGS